MIQIGFERVTAVLGVVVVLVAVRGAVDVVVRGVSTVVEVSSCKVVVSSSSIWNPFVSIMYVGYQIQLFPFHTYFMSVCK